MLSCIQRNSCEQLSFSEAVGSSGGMREQLTLLYSGKVGRKLLCFLPTQFIIGLKDDSVMTCLLVG